MYRKDEGKKLNILLKSIYLNSFHFKCFAR